ncbi:MAG: hypothetical protein COA36_08075 [Desulfotalea sp.]|nr:MAG: hypothetical protein COA36_08075 [Desulfotalea sp.]
MGCFRPLHPFDIEAVATIFVGEGPPRPSSAAQWLRRLSPAGKGSDYGCNQPLRVGVAVVFFNVFDGKRPLKECVGHLPSTISHRGYSLFFSGI